MKTQLNAGITEYPSVPQCENLTVRSISREDYAWLAGIVDGEGNLDWQVVKANTNGKPYWRPKFRVINTDVAMIAKISRILEGLGCVFFYNINRRRKAHYKDQLAIVVHSQGSAKKVLTEILPYLTTKRGQAEVMLKAINFVQKFPKGGNTTSHLYANTPEFAELQKQFFIERDLLIEPSETTRCAGKALVLSDDIVRPARRRAEASPRKVSPVT
jgi:hypothetical protein